MSNWIKWSGGECPVEEGTLIDVEHRDGEIYESKPALGENNWNWSHSDNEGDIIAYRLSEPDLQSRTNDANLQQAFDTVQRPAHYNQSGIECIDAIAASMSAEEFQAYLKGNVQKYLWRYQHKNGLEDVLKAEWYLNRLVKELSK